MQWFSYGLKRRHFGLHQCDDSKFGGEYSCEHCTLTQFSLHLTPILQEEFDYWKTRDECRLDMRGDDQSIHNYLYYTNRFKNAVSIPHRTGPIHVVGYQAARIFEKVQAGDTSPDMDEWNTWLPEKYGLTDSKTGYIVNLDGRVSPQGVYSFQVLFILHC